MNVSNTMDFRDGVSHTALFNDGHALPHGILNVHVDALQARTPEMLMNVGKVKVGISCGLVFQAVNQALVDLILRFHREMNEVGTVVC